MANATAISAQFDRYRGSIGLGDDALLERTFLVTGRRFRNSLLHLVDGVASGSLDIQGFISGSNRLLRDAFGTTYLLGALSIDTFHTLTLRDIRLIDREIEEERHFLRDFARDLYRGFYVMDPVGRAGLYLQALRGMFELGRAEATVGPLLWKLGPTEHCNPCLAASLGGPYQKDQYSHLGLPVLPGIPGIGDVCKGLTRCGCTLVPSGGVLPNQELAIRLRELLVEMLYDDS